MKLSDTQIAKIKRIAKIVWIPLLVIAVLYWWLGPTTWKEEVLLHDGSKIIVERSTSRGGRHEIGQQPPFEEQSLRFIMPGTGQAIKWTDSYSDDIRTASFLPMLLDVVDGAAYLVVTPMGCLSYNKWGRPNPPYVVFKYEAKEWKRIPLQELPAAIKTPNMISSMPDIEAKRIGGNPVSAEAISKLVSQYRSSEYRTILREPNDSDTPQSCIYMTKDPRGGWRQIGTSISKPSYEECEQYCKSFQIAPAYCPCNGIYKKGN